MSARRTTADVAAACWSTTCWATTCWAAACWLAACGDQSPLDASETPPRAGRFGSLRDLVLFERTDAPALFLDRFEVTQGDWQAFAATAAGEGVGAQDVPIGPDPTLPVSRVDLRQARAFAHWRFLRLPRVDEWLVAAVGDEGRSRFPWGNREDITRANTGELGMVGPTPVGTFESGRRGGGDQPYDLIGNVSEWTETIAPRWYGDELDPAATLQSCRRVVLGNPALAVWQWPGGVVPLGWAAQAGGDRVLRQVVGADFQSPMAELLVPVAAGDRRLRTGVRLCTTAPELLRALARETSEPDPLDRLQLQRFVRRARHREVLAAAWSELVASGAVTTVELPLLRIVQQELAAGGDGPR